MQSLQKNKTIAKRHTQPEVKETRNQTLSVNKISNPQTYIDQLLNINRKVSIDEITNQIIIGDINKVSDFLPNDWVDLLIIDPPYNLNKVYAGTKFIKTGSDEYQNWVESWFIKLLPMLKPAASVYVCCDWQSSNAIYAVLKKYLHIQNRITWEREKGRGAKHNWKNCSEDIWFATKNKTNYFFNAESVKLKRRVIAPYKLDGKPKDWQSEINGDFRLTSPSNLWNDITIPFWSMPENTEHPTQKPEKLIAKLILASSKEKDMVFDPFVGSGTTAVVANKLNRNFVGIEQEQDYCIIAKKRLDLSKTDKRIQGYENGIFWERNSILNASKTTINKKNIQSQFIF